VQTTRTTGRARARAPARTESLPEPELATLAWIGDQSAVRLDVIRCLLGVRRPAPDRVARDHVERWWRAGLVERQQFLAGQPPVVWLTRAGLRRVGCGYPPAVPTLGLLDHLHAVSLVRWGIEAAGGDHWVSERALHQTRPERDAHRPDGRFLSIRGVETAVEVELTRKAPVRLRHIVDELTVDHDAVLYVVRGGAVRAGVERAVDALNERHRVTLLDLADFALLPPAR
jgi:hypothetical protein